MADKWGITPSLVRRFCREKKIPKAKCQNGIWMIPENAKKPEKSYNQAPSPDIPPLARKLMNQKKKKNFHGLYDYVQIYFTYSSSRMASNRLTMNQVEAIFRKGKIHGGFEPLKISDLVEVMNHCVCVDYILDHACDPLTQKLIQHRHYLLMFGTVDQRKNRVTPGIYRTPTSPTPNRRVESPSKINTSLGKIIKTYELEEEVGRTHILEFHVRFEEIFPFEDGNGRVGRLIMFKECLRHNVMPFIIDDKRRSQYLTGIRTWDSNRMKLIEVVAAAQERFEQQVALQKLGEYRPRGYEHQYDDYDEDDDD